MMKHSETAIFVAESTGHMPLIDGPAAPVNIAPLRRLLAEQKASHYALDWKDLTQLLDEIDRLRAEVAGLRDALALGVTPAELARSRIVAPTK